MKNTIAKISSKVFATGVTFMTLGASSYAQTAEDPSSWFPTEGSDTEIPDLVISVLNWGIGLAALAAVAVLIVAGIMYITASGDEAKIGKATKTLTFAIIGLVVCFIAVMIVNFVLGTFLETEL